MLLTFTVFVTYRKRLKIQHLGDGLKKGKPHINTLLGQYRTFAFRPLCFQYFTSRGEGEGGAPPESAQKTKASPKASLLCLSPKTTYRNPGLRFGAGGFFDRDWRSFGSSFLADRHLH